MKSTTTSGKENVSTASTATSASVSAALPPTDRIRSLSTSAYPMQTTLLDNHHHHNHHQYQHYHREHAAANSASFAQRESVLLSRQQQQPFYHRAPSVADYTSDVENNNMDGMDFEQQQEQQQQQQFDEQRQQRQLSSPPLAFGYTSSSSSPPPRHVPNLSHDPIVEKACSNFMLKLLESQRLTGRTLLSHSASSTNPAYYNKSGLFASGGGADEINSTTSSVRKETPVLSTAAAAAANLSPFVSARLASCSRVIDDRVSAAGSSFPLGHSSSYSHSYSYMGGGASGISSNSLDPAFDPTPTSAATADNRSSSDARPYVSAIRKRRTLFSSGTDYLTSVDTSTSYDGNMPATATGSSFYNNNNNSTLLNNGSSSSVYGAHQALRRFEYQLNKQFNDDDSTFTSKQQQQQQQQQQQPATTYQHYHDGLSQHHAAGSGSSGDDEPPLLADYTHPDVSSFGVPPSMMIPDYAAATTGVVEAKSSSWV